MNKVIKTLKNKKNTKKVEKPQNYKKNGLPPLGI